MSDPLSVFARQYIMYKIKLKMFHLYRSSSLYWRRKRSAWRKPQTYRKALFVYKCQSFLSGYDMTFAITEAMIMNNIFFNVSQKRYLRYLTNVTYLRTHYIILYIPQTNDELNLYFHFFNMTKYMYIMCTKSVSRL